MNHLNITERVGEAIYRKRRKGLAAYLKTIPRRKIYLDDVLIDKKSKDDVADEDIKTGWQHHCGAVGCLFGWMQTYGPFRQWNKRHDLEYISFLSAAIYLGVSDDLSMELFKVRQNLGVTDRQEMMNRLKDLQKWPITNWRE